MRANDSTTRNATRTVAERLYHASAVAGALLVPALLLGWAWELVEVLL